MYDNNNKNNNNNNVLWHFHKTLDFAISNFLEMAVSIAEVISVLGIEKA